MKYCQQTDKLCLIREILFKNTHGGRTEKQNNTASTYQGSTLISQENAFTVSIYKNSVKM